MSRVDWTAKATADLARQVAWLEPRQPSAARRLELEVGHSVGLIADQPGLGFRAPRPGVRIILTRRYKYRLVYLTRPGGVTILRLLHPRQSGP